MYVSTISESDLDRLSNAIKLIDIACNDIRKLIFKIDRLYYDRKNEKLNNFNLIFENFNNKLILRDLSNHQIHLASNEPSSFISSFIDNISYNNNTKLIENFYDYYKDIFNLQKNNQVDYCINPKINIENNKLYLTDNKDILNKLDFMAEIFDIDWGIINDDFLLIKTLLLSFLTFLLESPMYINFYIDTKNKIITFDRFKFLSKDILFKDLNTKHIRKVINLVNDIMIQLNKTENKYVLFININYNELNIRIYNKNSTKSYFIFNLNPQDFYRIIRTFDKDEKTFIYLLSIKHKIKSLFNIFSIIDNEEYVLEYKNLFNNERRENKELIYD